MLKGKTALVTGSTSGIGLAIAQALADEGANIVLNGFGDTAEIEALKADISARGVKVHYSNADMTVPEQIRGLCDDAVSLFGAVDILINNAGIQHVSAIDDFPDELWDKIIAVNLTACFHTTKSLVPVMKKNGWGRIINIASVHGLVASPYKSAYNASKHGLIGFSKTIALEVAADNITVNTICPGSVLTPLVEGQVADQAKVHGLSEDDVIEKVILKAQPTKKFINVDDLAGLALFLCGPSSASITGASYTIDGGWTTH